jgi:cell division transport system permease protein
MAPRIRRVHLVVGQAASFAADAITSFRRNGLMTAAAVTTIMVALLVVGTAVLLGVNLSHMAATLEAQVEVVAFVRDGLSSSELARVQETIVAMPDVASVQFVSRSEALGRLRQRLGDSAAFADLESSNPLPDSLEVRLVDPARARVVAAAITNLSGVDEVTYGAQVLDRLLALTQGVRVLAGVLTLFLSGVALVVVVNTIRLTVIARQREIEIMRLVGATRWFVQWPLLLEGVLEGTVAAGGATVVLAALYALGAARVAYALPFFPLVSVASGVQSVAIVVAATGTIVGAAGSLIAVRRFVMS